MRQFRGGLADSNALTQPQILSAVDQQILDRQNRIQFLKDYGEIYWLPISLGIASPAPAAGTINVVLSNNQDFDLLLMSAYCDLRLSKIELIDSARNRALTNGAVPIPAIAQFVTTAGVLSYPFEWEAPYLLPAKSQLKNNVTADGTETGGNLVIKCKQPPVYQG